MSHIKRVSEPVERGDAAVGAKLMPLVYEM